jgi:phosphoserine phosphatase
VEAAIAEADDEVGLGRSAGMRRLRPVNVVIFDCDSTLSSIEGIDELARAEGVDTVRLTEAAMRGDLRLEQVYAQRLALIQPSSARVASLGTQYIENIVPDAAAVVAALQAEGIQVRVMSGGLRPAVEQLAASLGIAPRDVAAVDVMFKADGSYHGFDESSPLTRNGGKRELLQAWRGSMNGAVMFVGDGATDLETMDVADVFVAYAGVVERGPVVAAADVVVRSPSLAPVLALALGGRTPRHAQSRALYEKGIELLESLYRSYLGNGTAA